MNLEYLLLLPVSLLNVLSTLKTLLVIDAIQESKGSDASKVGYASVLPAGEDFENAEIR